MKARVLVVDDEPRMASNIAAALRRSGHDCLEAPDGETALRLFDEHGADVVVTDRRMPGLDGLELMDRLLERDAELPILLVTAYGDVRSAVDAMRRGAFDYVTKPFDLDELRSLVARALELRRLRRENVELRRSLAAHGRTLVAESEAMRSVLELVDRAASSRATVLLEGESGTGKELVARRLHEMSPRAAEPFVAINCKALAPGILESELFGHEKGAYTGAAGRRAGCFERADGGTLFLDEIGEVDVSFQAKLLRVLQEGEVQRVGGDEPVKVDVRVVAATHRDLRRDLADGAFREDLYYRLAVIPIRLPPLRRRPEDVQALARHFLAEGERLGGAAKTLDGEAMEALRAHPWPGNVRELHNVLERAMVLSPEPVIGVADLLLEDPERGEEDPRDRRTGTLQEALDRAARERIDAALEAHDGRRNDAARELGIDRTTLFRWLKRLDS